MGTFAPIVVYWVYAGFYQLLPPLDKYRLHTKKDEEEKNLVPFSAVVKGVLLQQLVQAIVALFLVSYSTFEVIYTDNICSVHFFLVSTKFLVVACVHICS